MATKVSADTRAWAVGFFNGTGVFGDLAPGAVFSFPKSPETLYVKGRGGWFTLENGDTRRKFRTGSGTAIVKVEGA